MRSWSGLKSNFTILDTDDQIRLMKQMIEAEDIDEKRWPARALAGIIDGWKNRGPDARRGAGGRGAMPSPTARARSFIAAYQERLKTLNAADFGDLLLEDLRLFQRASRRARSSISERFRYMLVDEYQDTNVAQYLWLRLLGAGHAAMSAAWATTTSRSMAGAARRSTTSCASRTIFPARKSSGWSAITARPAHILGAASRPDRAQRRPPRQDAVDRGRSPARRSRVRACGTPRKKRATSARKSRSCSARATSSRRDGDSGARVVPDARIRGALHLARPALSRDRRPALLRARGNPRRAGLSALHRAGRRRSRLRAHRQ